MSDPLNDVPTPDELEQQRSAVPGTDEAEADGLPVDGPLGDQGVEAAEGDFVEQRQAMPDDDDDEEERR
jgi:hypothetical protein